MYWYKPYAEMNITLSISQTKCKLVQIDVCEYYNYCDTKFISSKCQSYLSYVTYYSGINMSQQEAPLERTYLYIAHASCIILVLFTKGTRTAEIPVKCTIMIKFEISQIQAIKGLAHMDLSQFRFEGITSNSVSSQNNIDLHQDSRIKAIFSSGIIRKPAMHILQVWICFNKAYKNWIEITAINQSDSKSLIPYVTEHPVGMGNFCIFFIM